MGDDDDIFDEIEIQNSLNHNILTSKGAPLLFDVLRQTDLTISYLNLQCNDMDDEFMDSLGKYLQSNPYLETLLLSENRVTDKGIEILSKYLLGNTNLKELGLSSHEEISDKSIPLFIKMVESSHIGVLGIDGTCIIQKNLIFIPLVHNVLIHGLDKLKLSYL